MALKMECEICGKKICGEPYNVVIDGVKFIVCEECARFSSPKERIKMALIARKRPSVKPPPLKPKGAKRKALEELELVEDYGSLVKMAREKIGFSREDLGRRIGEKVSVIRKVEMNRIVPDQRLVRKLEHFLRIRLLVKPPSPHIIRRGSAQKPYEFTLGDVVSIRKRKSDVGG